MMNPAPPLDAVRGAVRRRHPAVPRNWPATGPRRRPWTPELRAEQEALSLVRFYSRSPISNDELMDRIRADATVSEPVRERALEFARQSRQN